MIKNFLKASGWVLAGNLSSKIINFLSLSILARLLGPQGLGVYNAVLSTTMSINQISDFGTSIVLQKESSKMSTNNDPQLGSLFMTAVFLQLFLNSIICFIILLWPDFFFNEFFKELGSISLLYYSIPLIIFQCLAQLALTFIVGLGEFRLYSIRLILTSIITLVFLVIFLHTLNSNAITALIATIFSVVINIAITWYLVFISAKKKNITINKGYWIENLRLIRNDGVIYYIGNTLIGAIVTLVLVQLFAKYISLENYGFLRIGSSLSAILGIIPAAIQPVTINFLSKANENINSLKSVQIRFLFYFIIVITLMILIFLNPIISILFGSQYLLGKDVISFILSVQIIILSSGIFSNFLVASGHTTFIGIISTLAALSNLILAIFLIPRYGIYGFYISHFVGYFSGFLVMGCKEALKVNFRVSIQVKYMIGLFILSFMGLIPIFIIDSFLILIIYGLAFIIILTIIFYNKILKQNEKAIFKKMLRFE